MSAWLGFGVWIALLSQSGPEPLLELPIRQKLRAAAGEIAKAGEPELLSRMRDVLSKLGDEERELERLWLAWEKTRASAKPGRSTRSAAANKLRKALESVVDQLERVPETRRPELAGCILALDSEEPRANAVLGRERRADGTWLTGEERVRREREELFLTLESSARRLDLEIEEGASQNPAALAIGGGSFVRSCGIEIHSGLPRDTLERILRQALRAIAFSEGLLHGEVEVPRIKPRRYLFLDSEERLERAVAEALERGATTTETAAEVRERRVSCFQDGRGWHTSRWRWESDHAPGASRSG